MIATPSTDSQALKVSTERYRLSFPPAPAEMGAFRYGRRFPTPSRFYVSTAGGEEPRERR